MLGLYEERYAGFTVKHFHEQLQKRHNYKLGYTVTRLALQGAGLVRRRAALGASQEAAAAADAGHDAAPGRLAPCLAAGGDRQYDWWSPSTTRPALYSASSSRRKARHRLAG